MSMLQFIRNPDGGYGPPPGLTGFGGDDGQYNNQYKDTQGRVFTLNAPSGQRNSWATTLTQVSGPPLTPQDPLWNYSDSIGVINPTKERNLPDMGRLQGAGETAAQTLRRLGYIQSVQTSYGSWVSPELAQVYKEHPEWIGVPLANSGQGWRPQRTDEFKPQQATQQSPQQQTSAGQYLNIQGAYFQNTPQGLQAVSDPQTLRGLVSGSIQSSPLTSTAGLTFASPSQGQSPSTSGGQTSPQASTGLPSTGNPVYDQLLSTLQGYLDQLQKRGQILNPSVEITPQKVAEFLSQAQNEIDPYYASQLKIAKDDLLRNLGYSAEDIQKQEQQTEAKYGRQLRQIGEQSAEQGFALSGLRQRREQELAQDTQAQIDQARRQLQFNAGTTVRNFAQQYGTPPSEFSTIPGAPQVAAGESRFLRSGAQTPFYELSPDVYSGLVGSKQFEQRAAVQSRASQLEQAFRQQEINKYLRQLTL